MNPFIYGDYATNDKFINREDETRELLRDLLDSQKIFLISPRRFGKTSLLKMVKKQLENRRIKVAYVDLFKCSSLEQFVTSFAKSLSVFEATSIEKTIKFIKNLISSLRPLISIKHDGEISIQIDTQPKQQETYNILEELLEYSQNFAKKKNTTAVIMFDEFQEIIKFGGQQIEKFIRAIIQGQSNVGYVFCGSKKDILNEMVTKKSRAFFGMGPILHLNKIDSSLWIKHINKTFEKHRFNLDKNVPDIIVNRVNNIPYYIQYLSHELWDNCFDKKVIKTTQVENTIKSIVHKNSPSFETIWENLTGVQQRLLQGRVLNDFKNIFLSDFLTRHQIGSRQAAEKAVKLLIKKDILEKEKNKYEFTDVWFGEWIRYFILETSKLK